MFPTKVYHYRDPAAVILGLKELRKQGLTPRGLLFVALDPRGEVRAALEEPPVPNFPSYHSVPPTGCSRSLPILVFPPFH